MKIRAGAFYCIVALSTSGGLIMIANGAKRSDYADECWFMGGIALLLFMAVIFVLGYSRRKKYLISEARTVDEKHLEKILIDDSHHVLKVYFINGDGPIDISMRATKIEHVGNGDSKLLVSTVESCYQYRSLLVIWPVETITTTDYMLLVSREMAVIIDYFRLEVR
ncbi:MAG: hypothetical protein Q4C24_02635 [Candidatus Saccharibacteria bacterium]|nr:hypothetical protein [Candidatus Saccharibacteria bacterium]